MNTSDGPGAPQGARLIGACALPVWGMTGRERARRSLARLGLEEKSGGTGPVLLLRSDALLDERLLPALLQRPDAMLVLPADGLYQPVALAAEGDAVPGAERLLDDPPASLETLGHSGFRPLMPEELVDDHNKALRKREPVFAVLLASDNLAQVERRTFDASYKGVTDFVTKFLWPPLAFPATRLCARAGISPNAVTFVSLILSLLVIWFFAQGQFLAGILCGWGMAFLDTLDGKLARVTLTSSKWGNVFDHGIDLVAPPLWWLAWWYGLPDPGGDWAFALLWIVLGGHIAGKLVEQAFISTFGLKIHVWRPLDSWFRLFTARRNPNLAILSLFALFSAPLAGYAAMALWIWLSLLFHAGRYFVALSDRRSGEAIKSWLT